jgi:aspartyl-tRNA(Asn)/glutamyl-tRNA(Gln) amidotransferase subunit B
LRSKEEAHDYRYFPEPDLMPLEVSDEMLASAREALPELPAARASRFEADLGLSSERARELAFRTELADYFERAVGAGDGGVAPSELANWIPPLIERIGSDADPGASRVSPESLAALATMVHAKEVSRDAAREVLSRLVAEGGDARQIVEAEGLGVIGSGDGELEALVDQAIASNPSAAEQARDGNTKALGPLVGYVMRETKGRADGGQVRQLILARLGVG